MRGWRFPRSSIAALAVLLLAPTARAEAPRGPRPSPVRVQHISARAPGSDGLSPAEREALLAGETVSRPLTIARGKGRYVGGVSYQLLRVPPAEVLAALGNPDALPALLPRTKSAELVGVDARGARIELTQGTRLVDGTYTIWLRRAGPGELAFRLDPSRPHGIADVHGFARVRAFGRDHTLLTLAVALDVGPGIVRSLFEDRIQRVILDAPKQIRAELESSALAAASRE